MNFYDVDAVWEKHRFKISLRDGGNEEVEGETYSAWGIHYDLDDKIHRLTYLPNGLAVGISGKEKEKLLIPASDVVVLKKLVGILNPYLRDGLLPKNINPMKKVLRDFINSTNIPAQDIQE